MKIQTVVTAVRNRALSPRMMLVLGAAWLALPLAHGAAAFSVEEGAPFVDQYCSTCHNDVDKEAGLDLTTLAYTPENPANFAIWAKVHDQIKAGEMPPKEKRRPNAEARDTFLQSLSTSLVTVERDRVAREGRATQRRLNRYEFENALRDLFHAPWLQVKNDLPEDGQSHLFNKVGDALDVSHVQMTRYLQAANRAIRQAMSVELQRVENPTTVFKRHYARDERTFTGTFRGAPDPERMAFPVLGTEGQPDVRAYEAPLTVGDADPVKRELEAVGWVRSNYHPFHTIWDSFRAPVSGRYRVRWSGYSIWVGPNGYSSRAVRGKDGKRTFIDREPEWFNPNGAVIEPGRREEPITVYAQGPTDVRRLGVFDVAPEVAVKDDLGTVWLAANESLVTDASRFFRNRPGTAANPLAQRDGQPGVAFRWMEVEGPIYDAETTAGYRVLFGDLPLQPAPAAEVRLEALAAERGSQGAGGYGRVAKIREVPVEVVVADPKAEVERLLRAFMKQAYRRPVREDEVQRYLGVINGQLAAGHDFTYAMVAGYTAVLCSPGFLYLEEAPGRLDDYAVASRLAFFLWNSSPDQALLTRAAQGELRRPEVLRSETERLLADPTARRFTEAFLDYWLELRHMDATTPSNTLYPDYYLDESLAEAALDESRMFFDELLRRDLPASNIVNSDFTYLNERLAEHYGISNVKGAAMRRVTLPANGVRGGMMTQAMVLKVTANGTTTSPVVRGRWIAERMLGQEIPAPPAAVPAVDPDTRGAVTIRQQLAKHSADESCAGCHRKIDPAGFALENFDVMGRWRDRYRADAKDKVPEIGIGKNGWPFDFHYALPVEGSGRLADGREFKDVRDFKQLVLADATLAPRNLARQLTVYATGAPVRFSDRAAIEQLLQTAKPSGYGVRSLVHAIVQSDLFLNK